MPLSTKSISFLYNIQVVDMNVLTYLIYIIINYKINKICVRVYKVLSKNRYKKKKKNR